MKKIDNIPDFTEKTVSFNTADSVLALQNIRFEEQGKRLFVVGSVAQGSSTNDWAMNRPSAIAWDCITDYIIFDSNEQYIELLKKSEID